MSRGDAAATDADGTGPPRPLCTATTFGPTLPDAFEERETRSRRRRGTSLPSATPWSAARTAGSTSSPTAGARRSRRPSQSSSARAEVGVHDRVRPDPSTPGVPVDDFARGGDLRVQEHVVVGATRGRREQRDRGFARREHVAAHAAASSRRGSTASGQRSGSTSCRNPASAAAPSPCHRAGSIRWVCTSITGPVGAKASAAASTSTSAAAGIVVEAAAGRLVQRAQRECGVES